MEKRNAQDVLDEIKLEIAKEILCIADMPAIRQRSLGNLARWEAKGTWCSAYGEWRILMQSGSDAEVIAAMTGLDQNANRLRQSPPYPGFLTEERRLEIWRSIKAKYS